jgi:hypothetical protein
LLPCITAPFRRIINELMVFPQPFRKPSYVNRFFSAGGQTGSRCLAKIRRKPPQRQPHPVEAILSRKGRLVRKPGGDGGDADSGDQELKV